MSRSKERTTMIYSPERQVVATGIANADLSGYMRASKKSSDMTASTTGAGK